MKTLTQAFAKTAAGIEKTVQTTVQEVTGLKALTDYELLHQIGSAGPALAWKLFAAKPRGTASGQYAAVCVWLVDKRALSEARARAGMSKAAEDAFFEVLRGDAARLVRMRHPGVIHVVQGLDETKNAMAFVTEPILASVANALGDLNNLGNYWDGILLKQRLAAGEWFTARVSACGLKHRTLSEGCKNHED